MRFPSSTWTDMELDEAILGLCEEFPHARVAAYSHAVEYCRHTVVRGGPETLVAAMRAALHRDMESRPFAFTRAA